MHSPPKGVMFFFDVIEENIKHYQNSFFFILVCIHFKCEMQNTKNTKQSVDKGICMVGTKEKKTFKLELKLKKK